MHTLLTFFFLQKKLICLLSSPFNSSKSSASFSVLFHALLDPLNSFAKKVECWGAGDKISPVFQSCVIRLVKRQGFNKSREKKIKTIEWCNAYLWRLNRDRYKHTFLWIGSSLTPASVQNSINSYLCDKYFYNGEGTCYYIFIIIHHHCNIRPHRRHYD